MQLLYYECKGKLVLDVSFIFRGTHESSFAISCVLVQLPLQSYAFFLSVLYFWKDFEGRRICFLPTSVNPLFFPLYCSKVQQVEFNLMWEKYQHAFLLTFVFKCCSLLKKKKCNTTPSFSKQIIRSLFACGEKISFCVWRENIFVRVQRKYLFSWEKNYLFAWNFQQDCFLG